MTRRAALAMLIASGTIGWLIGMGLNGLTGQFGWGRTILSLIAACLVVFVAWRFQSRLKDKP